MSTLTLPTAKINSDTDATQRGGATHRVDLMLAISEALRAAGFYPRATGRPGAPLTAVIAGAIVSIEFDGAFDFPQRNPDYRAGAR
jgi:hypothetical protein